MSRARSEFSDIVEEARMLQTPAGVPLKVRLEIVDGTIVDVWISGSSRFSFHWDRTLVGGGIYRHDNAPHERWRKVSTFPKHFHFGSEGHVVESHLSDDPVEAFTEFMEFVRTKVIEEARGGDRR